jgi:hypothetical protein
MQKTLAEGARSIAELVGVGKKRLKLAESAFEMAIFSDECTPVEERAAFYAEKREETRARRTAELTRQTPLMEQVHSGPSGARVNEG